MARQGISRRDRCPHPRSRLAHQSSADEHKNAAPRVRAKSASLASVSMFITFLSRNHLQSRWSRCPFANEMDELLRMKWESKQSTGSAQHAFYSHAAGSCKCLPMGSDIGLKVHWRLARNVLNHFICARENVCCMVFGNFYEMLPNEGLPRLHPLLVERFK